mgnify:CR=1 FL=1
MGSHASRQSTPEGGRPGFAAAILTGGQGTRLRPVLPGTPKGLAPVLGRPFLRILLDQLAAAGLDRAVLCTGHLGREVRAALGEAQGSLRLEYSQEDEPLDTAGALRLALPRLGAPAVLALNGDSCLRAPLRPFLDWFVASDARAALCLAEVEDTGRFGRVDLGPDNAVRSFAEKAASAGPGLVNAGVYLFRRGVLEGLPTGRLSLEREVFPSLVGNGLYGYPVRAGFLDIGTPDSYARADEFFAAGGGGTPRADACRA